MAKKVWQSMDGNQAAAWNAYAFTEVAGIYPIYIEEGKERRFWVSVRGKSRVNAWNRFHLRRSRRKNLP